MGTYGVKLVWAVKNDLPLREDDLLTVAQDLDTPLIHVDHLPKIVALPLKHKVAVKFIVVNGHDFGYVDHAFELCLNVNCFHIFPRVRCGYAEK